MNKKAFTAVALFLVMLISLTAGAHVNTAKAQSPKTIVVPDDYPTINQAIGNSNAGDTILLRNGTYTEQTIQINQSLTLTSEYPNGVTVNLHPPQYTMYGFGGVAFLVENYSVDIQASNVNLIGLTINVAAGSVENNINGGGGDIEGIGDHIQLANVTTQSNIDLVGNEERIQNSSLGALTLTGSNSSVSNSSFEVTYVNGNYNLLSNCNAPILELTGSENIIIGCSFIASDKYSSPRAEILLLANANSNIFCNNTVVGGDNGIELNPLANANGASYNIFIGNRIEGAVGDGIWVWQNSSYNVFYGNLIANNRPPNAPSRPDLGNGITLGGSSDGVYYTLVFGNILKNNFHNFEAAHRYLGPVFFDNGIEGNYWDDYITKCPNAIEVDYTGTGSLPYPVGGNSYGNVSDNHPLINEPAVSVAIPAFPEPWASVLPTTLLAQILPVSSPTSEATPSPSPTPTPITVQVKAADGTTVDLILSGNITSSQISDAAIATNQSAGTTTVSFAVTGQSGTVGFCNLTIPKTAVAYGTAPKIYIDGQSAQSQGSAQDANNYYVWFATEFSTHQVNIAFTTTPTSTPPPSPTPAPSPSVPEFPTSTTVTVALVATAVAAAAFLKRKSRL